MVAEYRCNQIKDEALESIKDDLASFISACANSIVPDFQDKCKSITKKSISYYESEANQYKGKIFDKIHQEMCEHIFGKLFVCFDQQLKLLSVKTSKDFAGKLKKLVKKGVVNDNFHKQSKKIFDDTINAFTVASSNMIIEGTTWGSKIQQQIDEFSFSMNNEIDTMRNAEIDKLQNICINGTKESIEQIINDPVYELNDDFWDEIQIPLRKELILVSDNCKKILQKGLNASIEEEHEFMVKFEEDLTKFTIDYIKKLFRDICTNMVRKFNKKFKKDEHGKNRDWLKMERPQIEELWRLSKDECEKMYSQFKHI